MPEFAPAKLLQVELFGPLHTVPCFFFPYLLLGLFGSVSWSRCRVQGLLYEFSYQLKARVLRWCTGSRLRN